MPLAVAVLCGGSCTTHRFYSPTSAHLPLMNRQHYALAMGSLSSGNDVKSLKADVAYSPLPYLGLLAYYSGVRFKTTIPHSGFRPYSPMSHEGKAWSLGGAVGGYLPFGRRKTHILSLFAGMGTGRTNIDYYFTVVPGDKFNANWRQTRWYLQPAIALAGRWLHGGAGLRFSWLNYTDGRVNYNIEPAELYKIQQLPAESPIATNEFFGAIGVHWKVFTLDLEYTTTASITSVAKYIDLGSQQVSLGLGIYVHELMK